MASPESDAPAPVRKNGRPVPRRVFDFFSSLGLATVLLLLLGILTWFATLEQVEHGLHPTLNKYFHWKEPVAIPDLENLRINGKLVPIPLPGGYWVCALLFLNLFLGGIIRIRKGPKQIGVIIAHFGILYLLVAGAVGHHFSERGNMPVHEGQTSDVAEDYFEYVVEVAEVIDGQPQEIHVIRGEHLTDLTGGNVRTFQIPDVPFDLQITRWHVNAKPVSVNERAPAAGEPVAEGYYLVEQKGEINAEANTAGCYARIVQADGTTTPPFILAGASFHPFTYRHEDRVFTIDMRKRLWPMPFKVRLDEFTAEFHPGTARPAKFVSEITRIEDGQQAPVTIQMNEPMRHAGLTFFQASYGPPGAGPGQPMYSVFEIVKNPADKWPEYSLYVVSFGLLVHFLMKLSAFLGRNPRKSRHAQ